MECPNFFWPWFSAEEYQRRYTEVTLHAGGGRDPYLLLPIIPAKV